MATPQATISTTLGPDVLWAIFSMNADMFTEQPRPLETARHTSQVCRLWRDLMIGTPTLWANIIDLQDLHGEKNRWRDEVMKRTGIALLNIKGPITGPTMFRILQGWLDTNWERVRILDVWALDDDLFNQTKWSTLVKPAPCLVSFRVSPCPVYMMDKAEELFGRDADSLTTITLNFHIKPPSWGKSLRDVTFCEPFHILSVLDMLPHIPCLESLRLYDMHPLYINYSHILRGKPPIVLPRLIRITLGEGIQDRFEDITYFLKQIVPAGGCSLQIFGLPKLHDTSLSGFDKLISRYAHNTFSTRHAQSIGIDVWNNSNCINCIIDVRQNTEIIHDRDRIENSSFFMWIMWYLGQEKIMTDAIRPFFSGQISSITTFDLNLSQAFPGHKSVLGGQILEIIRNLPLVQRLRVSEPVLHFLLNNIDPQIPKVSSDSNTIFPLLNELRIAATNSSGLKLNMNTINKFLSVRSADHAPIRVLDLTEYAQRRENREFLNHFTESGLKVIWEISGVSFEYICRSGDPRKLDLY